MKIATMSVLLCLAATAAAASISRPDHAVITLERRNDIAAALRSNGDISYAAPKQKRHDDESKDDDGDNDEDDDEDKKKKDGGGSKKPPAGKAPAGKAPAGKDGAKTVPGKGVAAPNTNANNALAHDASSPLWLVQPFGQSVWEQGRAYEIRWGPNPNGEYAKALKPNSPIDISLVQGLPGNLKEVAVLKKAANEATHKFKWTVPANVPLAKNYAIRIHRGPLDTYSHYFEIVKTGDARSSKSNVGDPEELPQKGDLPMPLNKGPGPKPAGPPNPPPNPPPAVAKPDPLATKPTIPDTAAKPITPSSAAVSEVKGANMLAFAMALFSAAYFL
ncbi:hypothetical protein KVV02_003413 [Mortierella alpina]|uniref:Yeast cell wall synthesis Kre9/Knh1-like N-terminal domain-containing protein n=1 Tax=Mortierella alpina TaxID=64518 RepID=A0A9P8A149_MORAP|nr:hypothetical protein KVV02_003413 [Mortierella alpina]